ncbi:ISKra4 family transposase [Romeria aff. gracilis LEGE 07310]|uniref:ISKra4 family transposase n=1 Tax=Vasconcelosia minhoensis LEGE 07310 TaxID=915328 RepID=A0A8J7AX35_9CYAN|nr:ISKra4 family transposase [Romeria gracilis]MBE9077577.1 ISKra4 family transposase [Romeria aff. gracilis LEGE 07310]
MQLESIVSEQLKALPVFSGTSQSAEAYVEEFTQVWRELGRELLQRQLQEQIEHTERGHLGARAKRARRYQTPLGTVELSRRVYNAGSICHADEQLGLPADGWFRSVQELSSALGVGSEFGNANRLLQRWSGVSVSEKTLANHVEAYGSTLVEAEAQIAVEGACPIRSSLSTAATALPKRPIFYIGADGIHTPMRQGGTCEAKVGVLFWDADHLRVAKTRAIVKAREYVATLDGVAGFREQLNRCYVATVDNTPHQVVFLGDGAPWLWLMASLLFPDAIQILDFFDVCEYLWEVARAAFVGQVESQQAWVTTQQSALKQSQWPAVVQAAQRLPPTSEDLTQTVERLVSYLTHNQSRIDYQRYLNQNLMIGSGIVESSNRRIVTMRLKQSGMFWSKRGAEAVMTLRACYLSGSQRWHDFWYK